MSLNNFSNRRYAIARIAHVTGDAAWWIFVVARLMAEMNSYGMPRRYADFSEDSLFGVGLGQGDYFYSTNLISSVAIVALTVTVIGAVTEAVAVGKWPIGIGTILAPVTSAAVVLVALYARTGFAGELQLNPIVVLVLVLLGVAVREVWSRAFAPRPSRDS
ncbi:hypothetical protein [Mycobacterium sp. NPDC050441]|uniref:hypothetical protein n=1 Tax=Mycobacterium sp. NPDC050441 TaxID=3155403 RepID=UPI0033F9F958